MTAVIAAAKTSLDSVPEKGIVLPPVSSCLGRSEMSVAAAARGEQLAQRFPRLQRHTGRWRSGLERNCGAPVGVDATGRNSVLNGTPPRFL
jgi:hypothetical protein